VRKSQLSFLVSIARGVFCGCSAVLLCQIPRKRDGPRIPDPGQFADTRSKPVSRINYFVKQEVNMIARCVGMLVLAGALLSLTGCNTVAGFGQDISGASRSVQRAL
jgi:predicted small secreted protein